ncbi:MT-A70 family methyltransferase [Acidiphilium angustum]|uniref:MT-A70 family methyltransferase n=1 Tax=Acidiphilium angustum TaxID=523 RepID=UPI0009DF8F99|nr:MT-A70 family methyltransferase [Acidiphilium angustum]
MADIGLRSEFWGDLPLFTARCILIDPPWYFANYSAKGEGKNPVAHYDCMDLNWIKAMPVRELADPTGCTVMCWATAPMLPQAIDTMAAWGVTFKSAGAWAKQSATGDKWSFGPGYRFRSAAEFFLLGTIGNPPQKSRSVRNLIVAPVREHSRKPDEMRAMCEQLSDGPYIEVFARERAPGWLSWGNETTKFDEAQSARAVASDRDLTSMGCAP